jgi:very-short-patch-repair endonuclease
MRKDAKRDRARQLRRDVTLTERMLWQVLQKRQVMGARFRRQHPVGPYVVDFACLDPPLVIEVDGGQHLESTSDRARDAFLAGRGFHVLRFWNNEVMHNLDGVYAAVARELSQLARSSCCNGVEQAAEQDS